jgi:hypothetical protein
VTHHHAEATVLQSKALIDGWSADSKKEEPRASLPARGPPTGGLRTRDLRLVAGIISCASQIGR